MQCDVLVIGAGPGGSVAAHWLARSGADVLLIDKAKFPRNKPCGDGLTPRAVEILQAMGLGDFIDQHGWSFEGLRIYSPDGFPSLFEYQKQGNGSIQAGKVIPRLKLDNTMRMQAISAGARFLEGFLGQSLVMDRGRLRGVYGRLKNRPLHIEANLVIVATGANRTLLKTIGWSVQDRPGALAIRAYLTGLTGLDSYLEIYLDRELLPGYGWVFPSGENSANVGCGVALNGVTTENGSRSLRNAFEHLLQKEQLGSGKLVSRPQGFPLRSDFPDVPVYDEGILIVGEAAGLVDPLTGEGIAMSLESGLEAAKVASAALDAGNFSAKYLERYGEALRERYGSYFSDTRELLARLAHPKIIEVVIKQAREDQRIRDALTMAVLKENPREGIALLMETLQEDNDPLTCALFIINSYQPLLDRCREYMLTQVRHDSPSPYILDLIGQGKMLRALLVFLGCRSAGGDPSQVITAAAGIELVHAASLIHDDIMDSADERRGMPALHSRLGISRAIVCGDYLIAKSFRLLAESRTSNPPAQVVNAFIIGAESGIFTCIGQFHDVVPHIVDGFDEKDYDQLIHRKTAAAIAGALMAGAALADGNQSLLGLLAQYGECVGKAFQIRDDVLDFENILPEREILIDRGLNLVMIHAYRQSDGLDRELIRKFYENKSLSAAGLLEVLRKTGAINYANNIANQQVRRAIELAKTIPNVSEVLQAFARYTVLRDH